MNKFEIRIKFTEEGPEVLAISFVEDEEWKDLLSLVNRAIRSKVFFGLSDGAKATIALLEVLKVLLDPELTGGKVYSVYESMLCTSDPILVIKGEIEN